MVRQHDQLNGHEFEQTPEDNGGQRSLVSMESQRVRHELATEQQQYYCHLCHRLIDHMNVGLFPDSVFLIYVFVFAPVLYCLGYCNFEVQFENEKHDTSSFVFSQNIFDYSESFVFQYKFQNSIFQFQFHWYFDRDCIESVDCLG